MERYMNKFVILSDSHHVTCHIYEPTDTDTIHNTTDTTLDKGAIDILGLMVYYTHSDDWPSG
jgi:hypothetical protein